MYSKEIIQNGRGTTFLRLSSETKSTLLQSENAHLCLIKADTKSRLRIDRISNDGDDDAQLQQGSGARLHTPPQKLTTRPHCLLPLPLPTPTHLVQSSKLSLKRSHNLPNSTLRTSGATSSASSRHRPSLPQTSSHTFHSRTASESAWKKMKKFATTISMHDDAVLVESKLQSSSTCTTCADMRMKNTRCHQM